MISKNLTHHARRSFVALALGLYGTLVTVPVAAADYPSQPINLVSPFAAGGTSDAVSRATARLLEKEVRQPVIVVNKPGAGGTIGVGSIFNGPADGYSLVMGGLGSVVFPAVVYKSQLKYDPARDLVPIGVLGVAPTIIVVRTGLPVKSLKELVALAKSRKGEISFASAGVGGTLHMAGVLFEREAGIQLNHVPYKGGAPAMTDLAGGNVDVAFADLTLARPFLASGRIRALAIASGDRLPELPDVPTTTTEGLPGVKMDTWYALFAPRSTPVPVLQHLQFALEKVRKDPAMSKSLSDQAIVPVYTTLPEFKIQLANDFNTWLPLLSRVCGGGGCN
jgi:tripartite-type tricarboxylate transporter receptor subunit TctC